MLAQIRFVDPAGRQIEIGEIGAPEIERSLFAILESQRLCSIASVTPARKAHIHTAYFCYSEQLELYFLSHPDSTHCRNLVLNPSIAMTIFSSAQRWGSPDRGAQLFGACRPATGSQARQAAGLYGARFPAFTAWHAALRKDDIGSTYRFYRFLPAQLKLLDEKNFGGGVFASARVRRT